MKPRARLKRLQRLGLIPRLGQGLWWAIKAVFRYPQPIALGVIFGMAGWGFAAYAARGSAFLVTSVALPAEPVLKLPRPVIGENIWHVDLRKLSGQLHEQSPALKVVRVSRRLPNTITVETVARRPIAQVHLDYWYPVDAEGFVLPAAGSEAAEGLLRLTGLNRGRITPGQVSEDDAMLLGLRVRTLLRARRPVLAHRVTEMNTSDPEHIRLILDDATEVRCGAEAELTSQLDRLQGTLRALAKQAITVRYIDLRFPDPVIGPAT